MPDSLIPEELLSVSESLHQGEYINFYNSQANMWDGDLSTYVRAYVTAYNDTGSTISEYVEASVYLTFTDPFPVESLSAAVTGYHWRTGNSAVGAIEGKLYVLYEGNTSYTEVAHVGRDGISGTGTKNYTMTVSPTDRVSVVRVWLYGYTSLYGSSTFPGQSQMELRIREISATATQFDSRLHYSWVDDSDSSFVYKITELDPELSPSSELRLRTNRDGAPHTAHIELVDPTHEGASPVRIFTSSGVKSLRRFGA